MARCTLVALPLPPPGFDGGGLSPGLSLVFDESVAVGLVAEEVPNPGAAPPPPEGLARQQASSGSTIATEGTSLVAISPLGRRERLVPTSDTLFRREEDVTPSLVFTTDEDGRRVLEIICAAYESARTGRRVELPFASTARKPIDHWLAEQA